MQRIQLRDTTHQRIHAAQRQQRWRDELAAARTFVRSVKEQGREVLAVAERDLRDPDATVQGKTVNWSAFARDSWRVRPNVTVNAGLRFD
mgnify:CR=1 FL=1